MTFNPTLNSVIRYFTYALCRSVSAVEMNMLAAFENVVLFSLCPSLRRKMVVISYYFALNKVGETALENDIVLFAYENRNSMFLNCSYLFNSTPENSNKLLLELPAIIYSKQLLIRLQTIPQYEHIKQ